MRYIIEIEIDLQANMQRVRQWIHGYNICFLFILSQDTTVCRNATLFLVGLLSRISEVDWASQYLKG